MHKPGPFVLQSSSITCAVLLRTHPLSMRCVGLSVCMSHILLLSIVFHLSLEVSAVRSRIERYLVVIILSILKYSSSISLYWFMVHLQLNGRIMRFHLCSHGLPPHYSTHDGSLVVVSISQR